MGAGNAIAVTGHPYARDIVGQMLQAEGRAVLDEWLDNMERFANLSPKTVRRRRVTLRRFVEVHPDPLDVSHVDIEDWLMSLNVGAQSMRCYLADLSAFYRWAVRNDHTDRNPTERIDRPKRADYDPRPIDTEDLWRALDIAEERTRRMILMAAFGGLRVSEVAGAKGEDVNLRRGKLRVVGKGRKARYIDLNPQLLEAIGAVTTGPIILAADGGHLEPDEVTRRITSVFRALKLPETITPHSLRHWNATEMLRKTGDITIVQKHLGHASPQTTMIYAKLDDDAAKEAANSLPVPPRRRDDQIAG